MLDKDLVVAQAAAHRLAGLLQDATHLERLRILSLVFTDLQEYTDATVFANLAEILQREVTYLESN